MKKAEERENLWKALLNNDQRDHDRHCIVHFFEGRFTSHFPCFLQGKNLFLLSNLCKFYILDQVIGSYLL